MLDFGEVAAPLGAGQRTATGYPDVKLVVSFAFVVLQHEGFSAYLQFQAIAEVARRPDQVGGGGGQLRFRLAHILRQ